jgi:TonB-dependent SusC/RagA subfamily outer membrane receptor
MRLIKYSILIFALLLSVSSYSQTTLLGKITNNKGEPVVNTLVYIDTIKTNTISNARGFFKVKVPKGTKKITLYSPKYGFMSTAYNNEKKLNFVFIEPLEEKKDTQVVIGYGSADKENLASNVDALNVKDDKNAATFDNIYDYIKGRVAGVRVTNSNKIIIRGVSTFNLTSDPLFVIDGVVVSSIDHISPIEVDQISILTGASASIYGSRGANGVIEITTKHQ